LTELIVCFCSSLTRLPALPSGLISVMVQHCPILQGLPLIPNSVIRILVSDFLEASIVRVDPMTLDKLKQLEPLVSRAGSAPTEEELLESLSVLSAVRATNSQPKEQRERFVHAVEALGKKLTDIGNIDAAFRSFKLAAVMLFVDAGDMSESTVQARQRIQAAVKQLALMSPSFTNIE